MEETLYLGQAIFQGAIGIIAATSEGYTGSGLASHIRSEIRNRYGQLNAAQQASLASYTFDAIRSARNYLQAPGDYAPLIRDLPDPRRAIQYAANQGGVDLTGTQREIQYSFQYTTRITDLNTGQQTYRTNRLMVRSASPLTRDDLEFRAQQAASQQVTFNSGTDPRKAYLLQGFAVQSVNVGFGRP